MKFRFAVSVRSMAITPGDIFLATPGYRELVRWIVGGMPKGGLVPGDDYWVLSESGIMGTLVGDSPLPKRHLGKATFLGAVLGADGHLLGLRDFTLRAAPDATDAGAPVYLLLGTSSEVGKTTAGLTLLRTLLSRGQDEVVVFKATGTSSATELLTYQDFGASGVFDFVDFGIPIDMSGQPRQRARGLRTRARLVPVAARRCTAGRMRRRPAGNLCSRVHPVSARPTLQADHDPGGTGPIGRARCAARAGRDGREGGPDNRSLHRYVDIAGAHRGSVHGPGQKHAVARGQTTTAPSDQPMG
jgi:hypothetical protein